MGQSRSLSTRSVVLVAVVALLFGVLGVVGTSQAAGLTSKQVKKIAAKVVKNKAPTLKVAKADVASTALSSQKLGGQAPDAFRDFAVMTSTTSFNAIPGGDSQILNPETMHIPAGILYVHITASATFSGNNVAFAVWWQMDSTCTASGLGFNNRQFGFTGTTQDSVSLTQLVSVSPGDHSFRLCVQTTDAGVANTRALVVETVSLAGD